MIKANNFRSSIRRHGTSNRKFSHSNRFILQKNSPACTTDAVLRKYGDTSARCTSFGPYFKLTMEIKTHFILNLPRPKITMANACATRPLLPLGFTGGEDATNILTIIFQSEIVSLYHVSCILVMHESIPGVTIPPPPPPGTHPGI